MAEASTVGKFRLQTGLLVLGGIVLGWLFGQYSGNGLLAQQSFPPVKTSQGNLISQVSGVPGQTQWLTLIDPETKALAVYRFEPNNPRGSLKLEAVRQFKWDLMLSEYQNLPPEVSAVESMTRGKR